MLAAGETASQTPATLPDDAPVPGLLLAPLTTAYTVGYFNVDFRYASAQNGHIYSFNGAALALMISSRTSSLTIAYGSAPTITSQSGVYEHSMVDVALITGGNIDVLSAAAPIPFGAYVPVRVQLGYRNLTAGPSQGGEESPPTAHLPTATLGAGGGAWVRIPTNVPLIDNRLVAFGSLIVGYGGMAEIAERIELEDARVTRTTDFNLEARLERFLADRTGLTIGYTYRTTFWSDAYLTDLASSPGFTQLDNYSQRSRQHLLRIGLNW